MRVCVCVCARVCVCVCLRGGEGTGHIPWGQACNPPMGSLPRSQHFTLASLFSTKMGSLMACKAPVQRPSCAGGEPDAGAKAGAPADGEVGRVEPRRVLFKRVSTIKRATTTSALEPDRPSPMAIQVGDCVCV